MRRITSLAPLAILTASLAISPGCSAPDPTQEGTLGDGTASARRDTPKLCAAVRGNGHYVVTHFASLARIIEHYGLVDAIAGGSSGTVTSFLYESIRRNPAVRGANGEETAARTALLLRSIQGYAAEVAESPEGQSLRSLADTLPRIKAAFAEQGVEGLLSSDAPAAARAMLTILSSDDIRALVNPEVLEMLRDPANLSFNAREVYAAVVTLGTFSVDNNRLFFRAGALSFDTFAALIGRVGDFYAGYGPADDSGMRGFLDACAGPAREKPWGDAATYDVGGTTCGARFGELVRGYRARRAAAPPFSSRVDELVGALVPSLVSTSVLTGEAVGRYHAARAEYLSGKYPEGTNIPFAPAFADIRFGYWGRARDLARVGANPKGYRDGKTAKFLPLGQAAWRTALSTSPAEPGLAHLRELPSGQVSAGGWSDLAPVLVLKNLGCERVVYVTREGDESGFATKIAKHLGMGEADGRALYDLENVESGQALSLGQAGGVWCTNWNSFSDLQFDAMARDSNAPPFEVRSSFFNDGARPYPRRMATTGKVGCTPGVGGGTHFPE